jgi:hypothetical protein
MKKINLVVLVVALFCLVGCDMTPKPGPMNYETPTTPLPSASVAMPLTTPLPSASVAMTSTGSMRTGHNSGLVLGGRCSCALEGQKIMTDDGPGYCLDGMAVKEEAYKKFSPDPKFEYTFCPDPRKPQQVK